MACGSLTIGGTTITPPCIVPTGGLSMLQTIMSNVVLVFLYVGLCFAMVYMVWGGMQWIRASGDKQKLTAARSKITTAIIGLILLLLSYTLVGAVGFLFKVNLLKLF